MYGIYIYIWILTLSSRGKKKKRIGKKSLSLLRLHEQKRLSFFAPQIQPKVYCVCVCVYIYIYIYLYVTLIL